MLGSCLCHLPKPVRDLHATGHLAQDPWLPATPCPSPATLHPSERCHKTWLPRASSAKACPSPALASVCPRGLGQSCANSRCSSRPSKCQWLLGAVGWQSCPLSSSSATCPFWKACWFPAVAAHLSLTFVLTLHAGLEWNDPQVSTYIFAQSFSSSSLSGMRQHLMLLTFFGNDENIPLPPLLCSPSA